MACSIDTHRQLVLNGGASPFCGECGIKLDHVFPTEETDYVTTLQCVNPQRALVAVMHYDKADDSYKVKKCSEPLSQKGAIALAESWAAALKLEVR